MSLSSCAFAYESFLKIDKNQDDDEESLFEVDTPKKN
jgi:hypothetical protein